MARVSVSSQNWQHVWRSRLRKWKHRDACIRTKWYKVFSLLLNPALCARCCHSCASDFSFLCLCDTLSRFRFPNRRVKSCWVGCQQQRKRDSSFLVFSVGVWVLSSTKIPGRKDSSKLKRRMGAGKSKNCKCEHFKVYWSPVYRDI